VNVLVSDALDPTSRMPEFKTCPVAVAKAAVEPEQHNGVPTHPPRVSEQPRPEAGFLGDTTAAPT
jgi:hypothetical protein